LPENSINALVKRGVKDLTIVSNTCGVDDFGVGLLLENGQIKRLVTSYLGGNHKCEKLFLSGDIELEFVP
jgi:3-oxoacid CoA-transferase subunit A